MHISGKKDWTVLYYLNGNNNLEQNLTRNLVEIEQVGSSDQVNIVAQLTRGPVDSTHTKSKGFDGDWVGTRRYLVEPSKAKSSKKLHSQVLDEQSKPVNAGVSDSLSDFVSWGIKNYPAKHYMIVIGDHGKGFEGTGFDYVHDDTLKLPELESSLTTIRQETGIKPDLLVFDACEMAQLEVVSQLKDQVGYMVASEEIIGTMGLPHRSFLSELSSKPKMSPSQAAVTWVALSQEDTIKRLGRNINQQAAVQLSAIDMSKIEPIEAAVDKLAKLLIADPPPELKELVGNVQSFNIGATDETAEDFRDLGHFCAMLDENEASEAIKTAAQELTLAIHDSLVASHSEGEDAEEATGMSVYLPTEFGQGKAKKQIAAEYAKTDFGGKSLWKGFLKKLQTQED